MEFAIDYQNGNGIYRKEAGEKRTKKARFNKYYRNCNA